MKIFIHIGDARTGSSTLQSVLTRNRARLRGMGVDYPTLGTREGKGIAHHKLPFSLLPDWPKHSPIEPVSAEEIWSALTAYVDHLEGGQLILSSEAFLNLPETAIAFVKDRLKPHQVTPICVRREPEDWRRSWRAHRIRQGEVVPEPKAPARDLAKAKLERWTALFDVVTVPYSDTVLRDVLRVMGLDLAKLETVSRRNESCSDDVLRLLNTLNAIDLREENRARILAETADVPELQDVVEATRLDEADRVRFNAMIISRMSG